MDLHLDQQALEELLTGPEGPVAELLARKGARGEAGAKRRAPVDTGRLRSSITHRLGRDSEGLFVDVGTDVEYARFVELGTSKTAAQPFLLPALDDMRGES